MTDNLAPPLQTSDWLNTDQDITLASLHGKVVLIEAFQMLCPACVHHSLPQAQRVVQSFDPQQVSILGLHTVFEHHAAMQPVSLKAFLHENKINFPVGIDQPSEDGPIPKTMATYQLQGTPSLLIIDAQGRLHRKVFGTVDDLALGAEIATLVAAGQIT